MDNETMEALVKARLYVKAMRYADGGCAGVIAFPNWRYGDQNAPTYHWRGDYRGNGTWECDEKVQA